MVAADLPSHWIFSMIHDPRLAFTAIWGYPSAASSPGHVIGLMERSLDDLKVFLREIDRRSLLPRELDQVRALDTLARGEDAREHRGG